MLDKNVRNVYYNQEKYKASYSQSKQNGQLYFDVSVNAPTIDELKTESERAVNTCLGVCNDFNTSNAVKEKNVKKEKHIEKKGKKPDIKGIE